MKILSVDDSGLFRHTLRKQLQVLGVWEVVEREDAASAAAYLEADTQVSMVIADHHMASGSGLEFLKWVRGNSSERIRDIPFVMVTSNCDRELILSAAEAGVSHYLLKPLALEHLRMALGRFKDSTCV